MSVSGLFDQCDIWELNHVHCETTGEERLTQVIWWRFEYHETAGFDFYVAAWRLEKDVRCEPMRIANGFIGTFRDRKDGVTRTILARQYLETFTAEDYELWDRNRLPDSKRNGLKQR